MNLHENTDFGRKVFFLNMPYDFQRKVIPALFNKEYEVYVLNDYRRAKSVLKNFPDSICFINVDDSLSLNEWFNFMSSFEDDPMLSTIFLGIVSLKLGNAQKIHFLMQSVVPAGFIGLDQPSEALLLQIKNILDLNGAKGRRRFVRADCLDDSQIGIFFDFGEQRFTMKIKDISSAGISCVASSKYAKLFKINMLIRDFSLIIRNQTYKCSAAVLMATVTGEKLTVVLVFTKAIGIAIRNSIKEYIRSLLQGKITKLVLETVPDVTDYKISNNEEYVLSENENIEEAEEIIEENHDIESGETSSDSSDEKEEPDTDKAEKTENQEQFSDSEVDITP